MSNVMSLKNLKNKVSRNGFDLSRKVAFTAKVGELLPILTNEVIPGDKFRINVNAFTRTRTVNTAAYTRIKEYYDYFFVPISQLWSKFPQFITQMSANNTKASTICSVQQAKFQPYLSSQKVFKLVQYANLCATDATVNNVCGFKRAPQMVKLLDYLGYGSYYSLLDNNVIEDIQSVCDSLCDINFNPFPLLAYQKIYQDFYRDPQWENAHPFTSNVDYIGFSTSALLQAQYEIPISTLYTGATAAKTLTLSDNMFDLRYCNFNKDYFFGLLPSPQYGNSAVINIDDSQPEISILAIRQAECAQRWKEIAQSGKQDYKAQMEKHFGVHLPDYMSDLVQYIGGTSSSIDISEVVNTNLAGDNESTIAGKGVGAVDGYIDFEAKEHGIIMCIYHAVPLLDYAISGTERLNLKTQVTDYAIPEFDRIGMQELSTYELASDAIAPSGIILNNTLGYAPRYVEYKTSYDRVVGEFRNTLADWVAPMTQKYFKDYWTRKFKAAGSIAVSGLDYGLLKVNPSVMDSIFGLAADDSTKTDQLLVNSSFTVNAVRNLDYDGLPY